MKADEALRGRYMPQPHIGERSTKRGQSVIAMPEPYGSKRVRKAASLSARRRWTLIQ
jgi:hypothetical protein